MSPAKTKPKPSIDRNTVAVILGICGLLIGGLAYWAWTGTPQLAADTEVYASLDALFTAVAARREPLVASCESQLVLLHNQGKIPEEAWQNIAEVIELAKTGQWESAAQDLYSFIERQKPAS